MNRIHTAGDQLASPPRHRGGDHLQLRDGPCASSQVPHGHRTPGQPGAPDPHCRRPAGQPPPLRWRSPAAARPFPRASNKHPSLASRSQLAGLPGLPGYRPYRAGVRRYRAAVPRPGQPGEPDPHCRRPAGQPPRHRGGDHLQPLDRSPGPAAGAHQTIQITTCPGTVAIGTAGALRELTGTPWPSNARATRCTRSTLPATSWPAPAIEVAITCSRSTVPPGQQQERTRPSRSRLVLVPWPPALPGPCASSQVPHGHRAPGQPGAPDPHCRRPAGQRPPSRRRSPAAARPLPRASSRSAPDHPDHDLSWYRGHRHCRGPARAHRYPMAIERQGNQVHQIHTAGDQLASARHRGGDHLQLLNHSPRPAAGAHQTIQVTATSWPAPAIEAAITCSCATVPPGRTRASSRSAPDHPDHVGIIG